MVTYAEWHVRVIKVGEVLSSIFAFGLLCMVERFPSRIA